MATTEQMWALHDAMPERLRAAVLLAGLRLAEACGLRVADVDFMRAVITPAVQYPAEPLKTDISRTPVPIAQSLALELSAQLQRWPGETLLTGANGGQLSTWALERYPDRSQEGGRAAGRIPDSTTCGTTSRRC